MLEAEQLLDLLPLLELSADYQIVRVSKAAQRSLSVDFALSPEELLPFIDNPSVALALERQGLWSGSLSFSGGQMWLQILHSKEGQLLLLFFPETQVGSLGAAFNAHLLKCLGSFSGKLGHDFNNYLGSITGCFDLIEHKSEKLFPDGNPFAKTLAVIEKALANAGELTDRLRGYLRLEAGERERVDLADLVRVVLQSTEKDFPQGLALEMQTDPSFEVEVNRFQALQLLKGLIENSCQALAKAKDKRLRIGLRRPTKEEEGDLGLGLGVLEISDSGSGVSPERLALLKRAFYTTHRTTVGAGFGLGLSMAEALLESWGGRLLLNSQAGVGTRVRLFFPLS